MPSGKIHNENHGAARTVFQVGAVNGDVVLLSRSDAHLGPDETRTKLLRHLLTQVRKLSAEEVERWGIRGPDALPVHWHTAADDLLDHWENIHGTPGRDDPARLEDSTAIRDTYQAISSKRLVILGRAGAGKTVLAHHLILDLTDNTNVTAPVPVLFSLSDWNPTSTRLRAWLAQQLLRDFPFLEDRNPTTGKPGAEDLVDGELILPVLDGFDEIPGKHHRAAIREISNIDWPLVLTSRPEQYAQAARTVKAVGRAAAIELDDLTLKQAHHYLRKSASKTRAREWDEVFDHLETAPEKTASQNLIPVLRTPLMVMLARTTYNDTTGHDPHELLDTHQFPTSENLEEHLLDTYPTTLYDGHHETHHPNQTSEDARHWLGHLATHLTRGNTHDLTWWQLPTTLHRHTRILVTATTVALVIGFPGALVMARLDYELTFGLMYGLLVGFAIGLFNETGFSRGRSRREPERLRLRVRRRGSTKHPSAPYLKKFAIELAHGFAYGLTYGLAEMLDIGFQLGMEQILYGIVYSLRDGLLLGLVMGFAFGLVNVVVSVLGDSHDPHATNSWTLCNPRPDCHACPNDRNRIHLRARGRDRNRVRIRSLALGRLRVQELVLVRARRCYSQPGFLGMGELAAVRAPVASADRPFALAPEALPRRGLPAGRPTPGRGRLPIPPRPAPRPPRHPQSSQV